MNNELRKAKGTLREIEKMCKKRPLPSPSEISDYIRDNGLDEYCEFASQMIGAAWAAEWILHTKRINTRR